MPKRDVVRSMQPSDRKTQCDFQPCDPVRRTLELDIFFERRMGSMIRGDGVDGSIDQSSQHGFPIGFRTQWRIHLVISVVLADVAVDKAEVVRCNFASYAHA